ncbi:MAG: hypothetical protein QW814_02595 [Methanothrix sp.]
MVDHQRKYLQTGKYTREYVERIRYVARKLNNLAKSAIVIINAKNSKFGRPAIALQFSITFSD